MTGACPIDDKRREGAALARIAWRMVAGAALIAAFTAAPPAFAQEPDVDHGRALVETNCAQCHAIGADDLSPHDDAPAFRELSQRYPVDALEEAFAEGIVTGHPDMPEFAATPRQIADIIAYLESIQPE